MHREAAAKIFMIENLRAEGLDLQRRGEECLAAADTTVDELAASLEATPHDIQNYIIARSIAVEARKTLDHAANALGLAESDLSQHMLELGGDDI